MPSNERRDSGNEHASVGGASARSPRVDVLADRSCSRERREAAPNPLSRRLCRRVARDRVFA